MKTAENSPYYVQPLDPEERPSFHDLQKHAKGGVFRKALARYLIPKNYEQSIERHRKLGTPVVKKMVMSTVGSVWGFGVGGNYNVDYRKDRLSAVTDFALQGSVFNELAHTTSAMLCGAASVDGMTNGNYATGGMWGASVAFNLSLVALQRYNRARMIRVADKSLQAGATFDAWYENRLGIDARAFENYRKSINDDLSPTLGVLPVIPEVSTETV